MECSCCRNKAKYDIEGDKCCGRCIGPILNMHLAMCSTVTVCKIEEPK